MEIFPGKEAIGDKGGERLFLLTSPPLFFFPASFCFLFSSYFLFLMSWSSVREDGLLVSLEGDGGELVAYSSLQECEVWFENGEPCHTLLCLFHSSICVPDSHLLLRLLPGPGGWGWGGGGSVRCAVSQLECPLSATGWSGADGRSAGKSFLSICQRAALS